MPSPLITILIVNYNSAEFVINTMWCLERITKNPYLVIIADNNSRIKDYRLLENACKRRSNVKVYRKEGFTLTGSMAHGTTLNELVTQVNTPYFSILDSDATWLAHHWDEQLINRLSEQVKVIGTQAPIHKPQDFPLMFCILFETKTFNTLNIDFRPKDIAARQDTGFEMREKYLAAGYSGENIRMESTRTFKKGPFRSLIVAEYYLDSDTRNVFASHFGRGSSLGANKYRRGLGFKSHFYALPIVGTYFLKRKGITEKRAWIRICKLIVSNYVQ